MRCVLVIMALVLVVSNLHSQCISGNCYNGHGKYKLSDRSIYSGQFSQGKFHGQGKLQFSNGDVYTGHFYKGKKENLGKYQFSDGSFYVGDFKQDLRSGKGKMQFPNGEIYKGEWESGEMHGNGEYAFSDGAVYKGEFVKGKLHGKGVLSMPNGQFKKGIWQDNIYTSIANDLHKENFAAPSGKVKNCTTSYCDDEFGAYYYEDGSVYFGDFIKGNPQGEGRCEYINGDIYEGGWQNHAPHGEGIMHLKNNQKIAGTFHFGNLIKRTYVDVTQNPKPKINYNEINDLNKNNNDGSQIYAVIVGVASYNHMKSLKYTDDDAYQLYAFLKSPQGGAIPDDHISVLIDDGATKKQIENTMKSVFSRADEDDVILLYLSGHGLSGAFVPSDFDGVNNLISYSTILSIFNSSAAKNKLCITDACHSGSMYASKSGMNMRLENFYKEINTSVGGVAMMTSSKEDEVSLEYSGMRQGVFSHFLIRGLKGEANRNNDDIIDIGELFHYVYQNVQHYTNNAQTPAIQGNYRKDMPVAMIYNN